jgi:hypothetical protein
MAADDAKKQLVRCDDEIFVKKSKYEFELLFRLGQLR